MGKKLTIIDCDPGADDALALLLALHAPQLEILGITSVCGNGPVEQTSKNAARVCALAGRSDLRIYPGAAQPMRRPLSFTTLFCGRDGLCETSLTGGETLISGRSAGDYLIETLRKSEKQVTLISTGCFTNLAQVLLDAPDTAGKIREIIAASGCFGLSDGATRAEWNIAIDPEAAAVVYGSGVPVRALGLDVSSGLSDRDVEELLRNAAGPVGEFLKGCDRYNARNGLERRSLLVDGMAAAAAVEPEIAEYEAGSAEIDVRQGDHRMTSFSRAADGKILAARTFRIPAYLNLLKDAIR